jgi:glutathione S-transferase
MWIAFDATLEGPSFMKLFLSPGACSLSPHIALYEAGLSFTTERVDMKTKKTASGADFKVMNPKGYIPALQLDDGTLLTEGAAIVQYIADQKPAAGLIPAAGTLDRYKIQEWLNYIATELHKSYSPLFSPIAPAEWKDAVKTMLAAKFDYVSGVLSNQPYLMGANFTVADGYLFTVLSWSPHVGVDLSRWPALEAFQARVAARPAVQAALAAEKAERAAA